MTAGRTLLLSSKLSIGSFTDVDERLTILPRPLVFK